MFYNYKGFFSLVILVMVDADRKVLYYDVGEYGSQNDAFIFNSSTLHKLIERSSLDIPAPSSLPESQVSFPYYFVGDDIFALKSWLLKPYAGVNLGENEQYFNYR